MSWEEPVDYIIEGSQQNLSLGVPSGPKFVHLSFSGVLIIFITKLTEVGKFEGGGHLQSENVSCYKSYFADKVVQIR